MSSIYELKSRFQNILRPSVVRLHALGVTANQVTLGTAVISVFISLTIAISTTYQIYSTFLIIPIWMFIRMALNAIDGMLAKEFGQQSYLGAYLNELCDVISDTSLYLCFIGLISVNSSLLLLVIFLSVLSEYAGILGPLVSAERRYDGPMGKSDRAAVFGGLGLYIGLSPCFNTSHIYNQLSLYFPNILLGCCIALLMMTIYNRVRRGIQQTTYSNEKSQDV